MDTHIKHLLKIFLCGSLLLILVQASEAFTNADSFAPHASYDTVLPAYGTVGPGKYEAECATANGAWTLHVAKRASKGSNGCNVKNADGKKIGYLDSSATTSSVCLNFTGASRVGIGYVAGNNKGKAAVTLYKANNVVIDTKTLNTYDVYSYNESASSAVVSTTADITAADGVDVLAGDDTTGAYEGDVDNSAADARMTFWAFQWMWGDTDALDPNAVKICVSPKGIPTTRPMVSLDYFVIGTGTKIAQRGYARNHDFMTEADTGGAWNYNSCGFGTKPGICNSGTNAAKFLPIVGTDAWKGFIPKIADPSEWESDTDRNNFVTDSVYPVIDGAQNYGGGANTYVPKYWILYNEPDMANFFF